MLRTNYCKPGKAGNLREREKFEDLETRTVNSSQTFLTLGAKIFLNRLLKNKVTFWELLGEFKRI